MLQTKALYNLLRLKAAEDPTLKVDPWVLEELRKVRTEGLFSRLKDVSVRLDKNRFIELANQCDTPEDLSELLLPDGASPEVKDPFYLIVFELWRRLLPEKQSLSIFFDELDYRINLYDEEKLESDELIQDALANLLEILDENTDAGADPEDVFVAISDYCAHDLETFIYDYILELLDGDNTIYASELIEDFSPYVGKALWFEFLRIRLLSFSDIGQANANMHGLLENEIDLVLLFEIIRFLSTTGEHELFKQSVKKALPQLTNQEELIEIMSMIADYYRSLDQDELEKATRELMEAKKDGSLSSKDIQTLEKLLV